jgi:bacterioferritin
MASKEELIKGLNEDLAGEYQAIIMYTTYAATVSGPHRESLKEFFTTEITDEQGHAQLLSNKIAALGGTPTTKPAPVPEARELRGMLQNVLKAETETIARYSTRMHQAEDLGDFGLVNDLQTVISDETKHKEETEMLLRGL